MEKKYSLPKDLAEKWVEALRNGKYEQGNNYLYQVGPDGGDKYCCLGICGILLGIPKKRMLEKGLFNKNAQDCNSKLIPKELFGCINNNLLVSMLVHMNDTGGKSFKQIANWVEKNCEFI